MRSLEKFGRVSSLEKSWVPGKEKELSNPSFIMGLLAQVKNGDEQFWK